MFRLICIAIGYCIGCIQTAFIMGKLCKTDLSKKGSGNLGTTNALRVLGFKAGAVTFIGDFKRGRKFHHCQMAVPRYGNSGRDLCLRRYHLRT